MSDDLPARSELRVLLLPPTAKDAGAAGGVFAAAGIPCLVCRDLIEVGSEIVKGAGVAVVPEEALLDERVTALVRVVESQPPWSDFPFVVLAPHRDGSMEVGGGLRGIGNMTLVRRPVEVQTLASTVRAALRDRSRQYAIRDQLLDRERQAQALRESEHRFRFLTELEAGTRGVHDPEEVMAVASRMLSEYLAASRCAYAEVDEDGDGFRVRHDFVADALASTVGDYRLSQFGPRAEADLRGGRTLVLRDVATEIRPGDGAEAFALIGINALVCCPLVKGDRLTAMMAVHQSSARDWTADEVGLVRAVAERSWAYIERARADRALRESEERYRQLADNVQHLFWTCLPDGRCDYLSPQWVAYTGVPEGDQLDLKWLDLVIHPDDRGRTLRMWMDAVSDRAGYDLEYRIKGKDGAYRWFKTSGTPIRDGRGTIVKWFGTCTDIDAQKIAEQAAQAAREDAEGANRMKDEFLATLSHELRTPLNAILGWAKLLRSGSVDEDDLAEGLAAIERNSTAQAQIIEDLLDVSRIVSGNLLLEIQRINLGEILEAAVASVSPAAAAKGIRFNKVIDPSAGVISGDPARLQQVVWNLLSNAVKFTPRGGKVGVLLERVESSVELSVVDSGVGIAPEFLPRVFDRFRQADSTTTRRHGGLGLGLAIVKQLVEQHGGTVRAKSLGPGQGATFVVSFPVAAAHHERPPTEAAGPGRAAIAAECARRRLPA